QPYKALLVPDEALQSDQGRKFVYVLNGKNEVVYRKVQLGQALQGLRVLKEGVAEGERGIVGGMQRVRPGVQVEARLQAPPPRPESPLARLLAGSQGPGARSQGSGVRGQESGSKGPTAGGGGQ